MTLMPPFMVLTFFSLFARQECLAIGLASMLVTKLLLLNFSKRGIGIINLGKLFLSVIVNTTNLVLIPD